MKRYLLLLFFLPILSGHLVAQKLEFKPVIMPAVASPSGGNGWQSPLTGSLHLGSQIRPNWQSGIYFRGETFRREYDHILFAPQVQPKTYFLEGGLYTNWTPKLWDFPVRPIVGLDLGFGTARMGQPIIEVYMPKNQLYLAGTAWLGLEWEWNKFVSMRMDIGYRFFNRPGVWPLVYEGTGFTFRTGIQIKLNP